MTIPRWSGVRIGPTGLLIAQLLEYYPKKAEIYITSGMDGDHGSVSHHYGMISYRGSPTAALDVGAGGYNPTGSRRMRDFAKWVYDHFAAEMVEMIHTTPFPDDNGFYVRNGKKNPGGSWFGYAVRQAHLNHVHIAFDRIGILRSIIKAKMLYPPPKPAPVPVPVPPPPPVIIPPVDPPVPPVPETLWLVDIASWQAPERLGVANALDLDKAKAAGVNLVNIKSSQGIGYTFNGGVAYAAWAKRIGLGISTFHWLDASAPGAVQAAYAYAQVVRMGGPDGFAIECDCEDNATNAQLREYVDWWQQKIQRKIMIYSGDWWWQPRQANYAPWGTMAALTPYYTAAPNAGYLGSYPGEESSHWKSGYGGWANLSMMQYAVSPIVGIGGGNLSKSAIRDPAVWTALTGGSP